MRVLEDDVINPGGGRNQYGHVHFKNRAVAIVPLDEDGNTWLVGQHRYTLDAWSWELPMGGAPLDEDPLAAARRELREETGIDLAAPPDLFHVYLNRSLAERDHVVLFFARDVEQTTPFTPNLEIRSAGFFNRVSLPDDVTPATRARIDESSGSDL